MQKLKVGIIGTGGIATGRHIPALLKLHDKVQITAVCDVDLEKARLVAETYHIPHAVADHDQLFPMVDAVVVCTPNKFHAAITVQALHAGVHVLCEKPMAMTTRECEAMLKAANDSGNHLSIAYHYRHTDAARTAKKMMVKGTIGDPLVTRVQALRRRKVPGWGVFTNKALQGGGSLIDYGCHLLDLSLWLLDRRKPVEVSGRAYNRLSKMPNQLNEWGEFDHETFDVDDHVSSYITFSDGASLLFECSWAANIKADAMHVSLSGSEAGLNVYPFELYQPNDGMFFTSQAEAVHDEDIAGERQALNFVNHCLGLEPLVVRPDEALEVSRIIEAIYESSASGKSISL